MKEYEEENLVENVFRKISYSTGFIWAKANKLKNKTISFLQDAKGPAAEVIESFKRGFGPSDGQAKYEKTQRQGTEDRLKSIKEDEPSEQNQEVKGFPQELLNPDFEKDIEEIAKKVAEV